MSESNERTRELVERALKEDAPEGDLTADLTIAVSDRCRAELRAKAKGVLAGAGVAQAVFDTVADQDGLGPLEVEWKATDGSEVDPGDVIAVITGPARSMLRAQRVAINLLSHLSGVATLIRIFVEAAGPGVKVLNTRKTIPGLRALERGAVAAGGGTLHRATLSDAVLIKDNHLRVAGGVGEAVRRSKNGDVPIEVEVETLDQLDEAVAAGADRILLDNPTPELVKEAVARVGDAERLEISGGVTLESLPSLVQAGARVVSVGRLTHSAPALDMSLEVTGPA